MPRKKRLVVVEWIDGDTEDADEIFVFADSDDEAASIARKRWRLTIGAEWPHCRLIRTTVMTEKRMEAY